MSKNINISSEELRMHGCLNCFWKMSGTCPDKYKDGKFIVKDICTEYLNFLLSFAEPNDSVSALWEKFNIYQARVQALEDYQAMLRLNKELTEARTSGHYSRADLEDLEARRNSHKMWWLKLNENIVKSLGRIVDRENKVEHHEVPRLTVQQLNILINDSANKLVEYENKQLTKGETDG
jgi:hypothetical protein